MKAKLKFELKNGVFYRGMDPMPKGYDGPNPVICWGVVAKATGARFKEEFPKKVLVELSSQPFKGAKQMYIGRYPDNTCYVFGMKKEKVCSAFYYEMQNFLSFLKICPTGKTTRYYLRITKIK